MYIYTVYIPRIGLFIPYMHMNRLYFCNFDIWSIMTGSIHSHKVDHEEIAAKAPELLDALQHAEVGYCTPLGIGIFGVLGGPSHDS